MRKTFLPLLLIGLLATLTIATSCSKDDDDIKEYPESEVEHYVSESLQIYITNGTLNVGQSTYYLDVNDFEQTGPVIIEENHVNVANMDIIGEDNITITEGENQILTVTVQTESADFFDSNHTNVTYINFPTITYIPIFKDGIFCGCSINIEANYDYDGENITVDGIFEGEVKESTGDGVHTCYPLEEGIWKAYKVIKHTEFNEAMTTFDDREAEFYLNHEDISSRLNNANNIVTLRSDHFNFPLLVRNEVSNNSPITNPDINGDDPYYISYWFSPTSWIDLDGPDSKFRGYHCIAGFYCFFVGLDEEEPFGADAVYDANCKPGITMEAFQVIEEPKHILYLQGSLPHTLYEVFINKTGIAE